MGNVQNTIQAVRSITAYDPIHVKESTFLNGLDMPVHRWFRLTPSFAPSLVDEMAQHMGTQQGHTILDPFAGASTTLIQAKMRGYQSVGFELNPFLQYVGIVSLNWNSSCREIKQAFENAKDLFTDYCQKYKEVNLEDSDLRIPTIKNVYRWWRPDILKELLLLKKAIDEIDDQAQANYLKLALAAALIPDLTNVTLGRLQLAFKDKTNVPMDVWGTFELCANRIIEDIDSVRDMNSVASSVLLRDSTQPITELEEHSIDRVITSPPYPNRYSYVWNTRPYMYFFDMIDDHKEASELDKKALGGTWGSATSILDKGEVGPAYPFLANVVAPTVDKIRDNDMRMANYVMKYFNLLTEQIVQMKPVLRNGAKCAYVVGNTEIKGIYVETDVLLGMIFNELGFSTTELRRFRKRNSGVDLFETIVYAEA